MYAFKLLKYGHKKGRRAIHYTYMHFVVTRQLALFEGGPELQSRPWQQCFTVNKAQRHALQERFIMLLCRISRPRNSYSWGCSQLVRVAWD